MYRLIRKLSFSDPLGSIDPLCDFILSAVCQVLLITCKERFLHNQSLTYVCVQWIDKRLLQIRRWKHRLLSEDMKIKIHGLVKSDNDEASIVHFNKGFFFLLQFQQRHYKQTYEDRHLSLEIKNLSNPTHSLWIRRYNANCPHIMQNIFCSNCFSPYSWFSKSYIFWNVLVQVMANHLYVLEIWKTLV